jgi:cytochrome c5
MRESTTRFPLRFTASLAVFVLCASDVTVLHAQTQPTTPAVHWAKVSVDLPIEEVSFPAGEGAQIADAYCRICHTTGMVLRQPPLTQTQWLAEIQKMRAFWGSPMPVDQDAALAAYLARINGPATGRKSGATAK